MRALIFPLILGVAGLAILISLGFWQLQRLDWKAEILADIDSRIKAQPVTIPADPDPEADKYLPVTVQGQFVGKALHVLGSTAAQGAGYRVIQGFNTGERVVLVDRGFVDILDKDAALPSGPMQINGNLHWPQETDSYTPTPDIGKNIWFARDVSSMAAALDTSPIMVIVRDTSDPSPILTNVPVTSAAIPNDHMNYAITWFSLAFVWFGMTLFLMWRIRRPS
jgi:surfeit locus 1 family protein